MTSWVVLSTTWKLEDVQAGLNVIITLLSATVIFTSSRFFWHRSARRLSRNQDVPLMSLLTFSSVGEVIDVITLLKTRLLQPRHAVLAFQCLVVVFFSLSAVFAGPISRYSTKVGERSGLQSIPGRLATRSSSCDVNNNVRWNQVFHSLEIADFPLNQLLDFIPDNGTNWIYNAAEWNSTYTAVCNFTPQTTVQLNATGNYVNGTLLALYFEIPELWNILSPRFRRDDIVHDLFYDGYRDPENGVWDDVILWQYVELTPSNVSREDNGTTQQQSITMTSVYMKNAPEYNLSSAGEDAKDWVFGVGLIPEAYYTKVECDINRNRPPDDDNYWEAYPQIRTNCDLAQQLDIYWSATAIQPSGNGDLENVISIPSGEDIFRFYQSWMISKDTYYPYPFSRDTSVRMSTVELSIVFIVICSLIILVLLVGLLHHGYSLIRHREILAGIPETKVDWLLQSVQEAQRSASSQLGSPDSKSAISTVIRPMKTTSPRETWKDSMYTWQQDQTMDQKGFGKIQVDSHSVALSSESPPISPRSPGDRPSGYSSYPPPAPSTIEEHTRCEAYPLKIPVVTTVEKDGKSEKAASGGDSNV